MIVAVWGPGQGGKTTFAVNFSIAMARNSQSVCLISAEKYGELGLLFGERIPQENSISQAVRWEKSLKDLMPQDENGVQLLCPSTESSVFEYTISAAQAQQLLKLASTTYDYVVVDCTSELYNEVTGTALALADLVLLTVGGKITSYAWATAHEQALRLISSRMLAIKNTTVRDFDYDFFNERLDLLDFKLSLPYVPDMEVCSNNGKAAYLGSQLDKAARNYRRAIDAVVKEVEERNVLFTV